MLTARPRRPESLPALVVIILLVVMFSLVAYSIAREGAVEHDGLSQLVGSQQVGNGVGLKVQVELRSFSTCISGLPISVCGLGSWIALNYCPPEIAGYENSVMKTTDSFGHRAIFIPNDLVPAFLTAETKGIASAASHD